MLAVEIVKLGASTGEFGGGREMSLGWFKSVGCESLRSLLLGGKAALKPFMLPCAPNT